MDTNKKLILLFIYYLLFISSFYCVFQIRHYMIQKNNSNEINVNFLWFNVTLHSVKESLNLKIVFYMICALSLLASFFMVYITISYNFDVIKDKGLKKEIEEELLALNYKKQDKDGNS